MWTSHLDIYTQFRRRNLWVLAVIAKFSLMVNALLLTGPLYMLQVYDRVLGSRSEETLVALTMLVGFLFLMMAILDYARSRVGARYGARLQHAIDDAVFRSSIEQIRKTGTPQASLQDLNSLYRLTSAPVFMALFDLPWSPLFILAIFLFHPWLGILAVVGGLILVAIALLNRTLNKEPIAAAALASNRSAKLANEVQGQAETLMALGMGQNAFHKWQRQRAVSLEEGMRASDQVGRFTSATKSIRLFLQSTILGLGAYLVLQSELTAGAMIAGSILLGRALAPIEMTISQWDSIAEASQARRRLIGLFQTAPEQNEGMALPFPKAELEVSHLSVTPPQSDTPTLSDVNFRIEPGEAIGVIGPSGSGKSTLARVLTSVWEPTTGQVRLDNAKLDQYGQKALGQYVGYLPQSVTLFDGTIAENIARLSDTPDAKKVVEAAKAAAAHDMILNLPDGYNTQVQAASARLSGGQIQRIGLARALYGDPVLLILDEPNSALDSEGSQALNTAVKRLKSDGRSVVIMAHRPSAIKECDKLLVLMKGRQVTFGRPKRFFKRLL